MMKNKFIWLLITLVLGALGSGLWELAFRPVLAFFGTAALNIVTLGLDSLRNGLYEEAARGQYERVGISMMSAGAGLMVGISSVVLFIPTVRKIWLRDHQEVRVARGYSTTLLFIFVTILALLLFQRVAYINLATNHFEQLAQIAAPYQNEQQRLLVRSQFAQVTSRAEYMKVLESLSAVGRANNAKLPEFTVY